ncbi:MarR family transcriptional regulator [Neobacillus drentensis]|uniref:MarR family winged helix-turn-helix transcriptional regulator n=1 Tax=Neobacillus drentensis TaxID=220684 RepID=UPI002FFD9E9E
MDDHSLEMIELELAVLIRRVTSIANTKRFVNLDRSAYLLLHQINCNGSAGVKSLASEFDLDISTVSRQTAALEQKRYVYRVQDPVDGRSYSLQITELGKKELMEYKQLRLSRIEEVLKDWPEDERKVFGQLLKKFNISVMKR